MNGDFLDRLVARARGEAPALRPVTLPGAIDQSALAEPFDRSPRRFRQAAQVEPTVQVEPTGPVATDSTAVTSENVAAASVGAIDQSALAEPFDRSPRRFRQAAQVEPTVQVEPTGPVAADSTAVTGENVASAYAEAAAESRAHRPPPTAREFAVHRVRSGVPAAPPAREFPSSTEAPGSARESPPLEPVVLPTGSKPPSGAASAPVPLPAPYEAWRREVRPQPPQSPPLQRTQSPPQSATPPPLPRTQPPPPSRFPPLPQPPQETTRMRRRRPRPAISLDDYLREREARRG